MFGKRAILASLAASLAVPPAALAASRKDMEEEAKRQAQTARRHEQELGQAQAQHEKGTAAPLDDQQRNAIGALVARSDLEMRIGELGRAQGQSTEVKNHGRWLADDHRRVAEDLGKLLRARGADPASLPKGDEVGRLEGELGTLAKTSPQEFDRAYVDFLTRHANSAKEAAGRARDATPGSDADLKWYLDQVERLEIGHRDVARQLSSPRAQARTPGAPAATGTPQQPSAPEQARRRARGNIGR
jgi:hypothetical protein